MNNVLVVGGSGYIGRHLKMKFPNFIFTGSKDFDLNVIDEIENFCKNIKIDICIILAAKISYDQNIDFNQEPFKTNLYGLNNLLSILKKINGKIKIVYFSSMTVYDKMSKSPVVENANLLPLHSYGLSKIYAEELIKFYEFKSVIFRIPGVYGGDRKNGFIYNTIKTLQNNEPINITTENMGYWETIYIYDLLAIFETFLSNYKFKNNCEIFNIAYGEKTDFIETAYFIKKQLNSKSIINIPKKYTDIFLSNEKISKYSKINFNYFDSLLSYLNTIISSQLGKG